MNLPLENVTTLLSKNKGIIYGEHVNLSEGITTGRYMEDDISDDGPKDAHFPNWDDFPLKESRYKVGNKQGRVIMINPERSVLAKWIIASCLIAVGRNNLDQHADKLADAIIEASGSQFVIAGIVLENGKAYTFRDGVTVKLRNGLSVGYSGNYDETAIEYAINEDSPLERTATGADSPARIQSTTRQMYKNYMGANAKHVGDLNWLPVVRDLYKDAWIRSQDENLDETTEKYRNDLMIARCYSLFDI
jgi:hypothetical protein